MSRHDYTKYSNNNKHAVETDDIPTFAFERKTEPVLPVIETVETVALPMTVKGTVANCAKLNVRVTPSTDAEIVCVLNTDAEIEIDTNKSTADWLKICTAVGIEGYCMRKYINANL